MDTLIDVQFELNASSMPTAAVMRAWVERSLQAADRGVGEIAIRVVSESEMTALNRDYRDQPKPTNVLSFPAGNLEGLPPDVAIPLGDIVICAPVVQREAAEQGKLEIDHWAHMLVHGTLHLLGFDHVTDSQALEMEALERQILASSGVGDPYVTNT